MQNHGPINEGNQLLHGMVDVPYTHYILNNMNPVLVTTARVYKSSQYVRVNVESIDKFCDTFDLRRIRYWIDVAPIELTQLDDDDRLNFLFVFNAINFCYWGDPKWTTEYKGKRYDGAWGMMVALKRALDDGIPILDAKYLSNLTHGELATILRGDGELPLFDARLQILHEVGNILHHKFGGRFSNVVKLAAGDTLKLLDIVTYEFPSFNDFAFYRGYKVYFHKRAQLLIADIYRSFKGQGIGNLHGIEQLTCCADYKIPQVLRKLGILEYTTELADKVDNKVIIPHGSIEEIEIRANTIWAVEFIKSRLKSKSVQITAMDIDSYLWLLGQNKSPKDKPYHRTYTICY